MLGVLVPAWVVDVAQDLSNPAQVQLYRVTFALVVSCWVLAMGILAHFTLIFADFRIAVTRRRRDGALSALAVGLGRTGQAAFWLALIATVCFSVSALVFEAGTYGWLDRDTFAPVIRVCRAIFLTLNPS